MSAGFGYVPVYVPSAAASARARASRVLVGALRNAGTTNEAAATPLETHSSIEERQLKRLASLGAVRVGRNGGYWLDEQRYAEIRRARHRLIAMILLVEAGVIVALLLNLPHHP